MQPGRATSVDSHSSARPGPLTAAILAMMLCLGLLLAPPAVADDSAYPGQRKPTEGFGGTVNKPDKVTELNLKKAIDSGAPIVPGAFADPFLLEETDGNYVYATNTASANIPVLRISRDGEKAEYLGDAMPDLPSWTKKGFQWAPATWARPDGTFVLYYSTPAPGSDRQCISAATSDSPTGPFTDNSTTPMICPLAKGGAIDPSPFLDEDGNPFLLWKADGNCCDLTTTIYMQPLSADGLSTDGDATKLISDTQDWEKGIVEAPSMVKDGSHWWLFYSGNDWNTGDYAIGIARCSSQTGPCEKPLDRAWQTSAEDAVGPGGQQFFNHSSGLRMVHHGWLPGEVDTADSTRRLFLDEIVFDDSGLPQRHDASVSDSDAEKGSWVWFAGAAVAVLLAVGVTLAIRRSPSTLDAKP